MTTFPRTGIGLIATLLICAASRAAEVREPAQADVPKSIPQLIADLDANDYRIRQRATARLAEAGRPAIAPLVQAADGGSLEVIVRVVSVLEHQFIGERDDVGEAAEQALDQLAASSNRMLAQRAAEVLNSHTDLQAKRALARVERWGGVVIQSEGPSRRVVQNGRIAAVAHEDYQIAINSDWRGGDEGLNDLRKLSGLVAVYRVAGNPVSDNAWEQLERDLTDVKIQRRGDAYLGIAGMDDPTGAVGCRIQSIKDGSAAEKAGLRPGDLLTEFDGKTIETFDALIAMLQQKGGGDKVFVKGERQGLRGPEQFRLQVTLDKWK